MKKYKIDDIYLNFVNQHTPRLNDWRKGRAGE